MFFNNDSYGKMGLIRTNWREARANYGEVFPCTVSSAILDSATSNGSPEPTIIIDGDSNASEVPTITEMVAHRDPVGLITDTITVTHKKSVTSDMVAPVKITSMDSTASKISIPISSIRPHDSVGQGIEDICSQIHPVISVRIITDSQCTSNQMTSADLICKETIPIANLVSNNLIEATDLSNKVKATPTDQMIPKIVKIPEDITPEILCRSNQTDTSDRNTLSQFDSPSLFRAYSRTANEKFRNKSKRRGLEAELPMDDLEQVQEALLTRNQQSLDELTSNLNRDFTFQIEERASPILYSSEARTIIEGNIASELNSNVSLALDQNNSAAKSEFFTAGTSKGRLNVLQFSSFESSTTPPSNNDDISVPNEKILTLADYDSDDCALDKLKAESTDDLRKLPRAMRIPLYKRSQSEDWTAENNGSKTTATLARGKTVVIRRNSKVMMYKRQTIRNYELGKEILLERNEEDVSLGFHVFGDNPVIISTVETGSLAQLSGLEQGDVIMTIDDQSVINSTQMEVANLLARKSSSVKLGIAKEKLPINRPLMAGYLHKQGGSGVQAWKRRWFELMADNYLYYYRNEEENEPLGALFVPNYSVTKASLSNRDHVFRLLSFAHKSYFLQADSEADIMKWVSVLNKAATSVNSDKGFVDVSSPNVSVHALTLKNPDCHGFLYRRVQGVMGSNWKRRYCVLKDATLFCYSDLQSSGAIDVENLHGYAVQLRPSTGKKFEFKLEPPSESMKTYHFYAENESDQIRWVESLIKSIGKWVTAGE